MGWAHRDVKLENVFLTGDGDIPDAYLGDLGFAKWRDVANGEMFEHPVGTWGYCAPELLNRRPYDEKVDMWAFGVALFQLLARSYPFGRPDEDRRPRREFLERVRKGEWNRQALENCRCSDAACDLLEHLFDINPADRFSAEDALNHPFFVKVTDLVKSTKEAANSLDEAMNVQDDEFFGL